MPIPVEIKRRHTELSALLSRANILYYVEAAPAISDREYDDLYRELEELEKTNPELQGSDSPTQKIGAAPLKVFASYQHSVPMQSLDNTFSAEELRSFVARVQKGNSGIMPTFVMEPKIDGVAVSLRYENGTLVRGGTRGDGREGDDITLNLRTLKELPTRVEGWPEVVEVRGEVYMTHAGFARMNEKRMAAGEPAFANARNSAAGTLKLLDSREVAKRPLSIVLYGLGEVKGKVLETQLEMLDFLRKGGMPTPPWSRTCAAMDELIPALAELDEARNFFPFATDGAVIKVNETSLRQKLGSTSKAPRWAIAYKFYPEQAETELLGVTFQVGRTGVITPVAELSPVALSGTTVSRATLHNFEEIRRKDIHEGDTVLVEKAGEIIPAVMGVIHSKRLPGARPIQVPATCPVCKGELIMQGVFLRCENPDCQAQIKRRLQHFAHRGAMDINHLGEAVIDQLVDCKCIATLDDLYRLNEEKLLSLERMGSKSAANLLNALEASKKQPLWRLIFGLGILHVGAGVARQLEKSFESLEQLAVAEMPELLRVADVGEIVALSIFQFFRLPEAGRLITALKEAGVNLKSERPREGEGATKLFAGKKFVITGTLSRPREHFEERIRALGGDVAGTVSSKTSYLLAGDDAGSKMEKAQKIGIPIVSEHEFEGLALKKGRL